MHTDLTKRGLGGSEGELRILEPEGPWDSSLVLGGIHLKKKVIIFHTLLFLPMVGTTVALLGERKR